MVNLSGPQVNHLSTVVNNTPRKVRNPVDFLLRASILGNRSLSSRGSRAGRSSLLLDTGSQGSRDGDFVVGVGGSSSSRARRRTRVRTADGKVNTRLIGLVNRLRKPVPLQYTVTSRRALVTQVLRDRHAEIRLILGDARLRGSVLLPRLQRTADNAVRGGIDNRDVSDTRVWRADVDLELDGLAWSVGLDVVLVVGEFVALAEPDVALFGIVVVLALCDLELALHVAVVVGFLVVVDLFAAGRLHGGAGHSRGGFADEAVALD